jgi:uncharacterized membrane protein YecN with MAPEG domain
MARVNSEQWLGDKSSSAATDPAADAVFLANRCHQNFTENVPLALFIGSVVELNGGSRKALTGGLAALLLFRVLHVELGLRSKDSKGTAGLGVGRIVGHFGTLGFLVGMSGYAGWLVKGYWGL